MAEAAVMVAAVTLVAVTSVAATLAAATSAAATLEAATSAAVTLAAAILVALTLAAAILVAPDTLAPRMLAVQDTSVADRYPDPPGTPILPAAMPISAAIVFLARTFTAMAAAATRRSDPIMCATLL